MRPGPVHWDVVLTYIHYEAGVIGEGGTYYNGDSATRNSWIRRPETQYAKLGIPRGDWDFSMVALDIAMDIRDRQPELTVSDILENDPYALLLEKNTDLFMKVIDPVDLWRGEVRDVSMGLEGLAKQKWDGGRAEVLFQRAVMLILRRFDRTDPTGNRVQSLADFPPGNPAEGQIRAQHMSSLLWSKSISDDHWVPIGRTLSSRPSSNPCETSNGTPPRAASGESRHEAPSMPVSPQTPLTVLTVATEWTSRHGGLSTLNRSLCMALAQSGHRVFCLVPIASTEERTMATESGVTLVEARGLGSTDPLMGLFRPARMPEGVVPDVVIGHGRITGPAAKAQVEDSFQQARRIHFVHMSAGEIEWHKERSGAAIRAEEREQQELDLCREADLVVAVGPRLYREVGNLLVSLDRAPPLVRFDPSLGMPGATQPPPGLHLLMLGRAEDLKLKGLDIAARAVGALASRPSLETHPTLVVRGAPVATGDELRTALLEHAGVVGLDIRVREYTDEAQRIVEDLKRASVVLMPSRAEGFGLVALEAIAAGIPVLVSDKSGMGELLVEALGPVRAASFVIKVTGDLNVDGEEWARAIESLLRDRPAAFHRIAQVGKELASRYTWEAAIAAVEQLGPDTSNE